ncbi:MAG: phosphoribosylamine--glycine ligase [Patescibacteria group bacterium]|nr:phosphoribosylamine--glycine ligase [Patescibacteria group bacterium]
MNKINILIIGSGGREHAIAWKATQSPQAGTIYVAPGNPGTAMLGCKNIPLTHNEQDIPALVELACHLEIGLVIVGPETALARGIVLAFKNRGIPTFGPAIAWFIEASKVEAKKMMEKVGIPTADFWTYTWPEVEAAKAKVRELDGDCVIKADGLAAGKGVTVCKHNIPEAEAAVDDLLVKKKLGMAGEKIVIEKRLEGMELSAHVLCDGEHIKMFPFVRDHKRLLDGNEGPMTGGMGVCGPIDVDPALAKTIEEKIVMPLIKELGESGMPFVGCLYPGLMITKDGPMVLEFNARFGDPEAQAYMRLLSLETDLVEVLLACTQGRLDQVELHWRGKECLVVTLTADGYPDSPRTGDLIVLDHIDQSDSDGPIVFHCGTCWRNGYLTTNGGRILSYTDLLPTNDTRSIRPNNTRSLRGTYLKRAFDEIKTGIDFDDMHYRTDIGMVW